MTIDEQIAILQAAKAGKAIEFIPRHSLTPRKRGLWIAETFNFVDNLYRIKREPREWVLVISGFSTQAFEVRKGENHQLPAGVVPNIRVREVLDGEQ